MRLPGLRGQRELRCWSVADVARAAGCTWATAAQADEGAEVTPATARKILLALEASPPSPTAIALVGADSELRDPTDDVSAEIADPPRRSARGRTAA